MKGHCSSGNWPQGVSCATKDQQIAEPWFYSARGWHHCNQGLMILNAPSGTHRVVVDLLHQLCQAIVFSFSSQFQEVFPVRAICGVG